MGSAFSVTMNCPQIGSGLATLTAGTAVTLSTYFLAASTDTNDLGFAATLEYTTDLPATIGSLSITYTDISTRTASASCSISASSATQSAGAVTTIGSVLCGVPNTAIGTGVVYLAFDNADTSFAFYAGKTTITSDAGIKTDTAMVPGQTVYLTTDLSTTFDSTTTTTQTVTLTGPLSTSFCSPTTTTIIKSSTFDTITSTTSKAVSSTPVSTKSGPTTIKPSTTSSHLPCTTGQVFQTISNHPVIAKHLCRDLDKHRKFPSSISVWPAATISSACSCYDAHMHAKRSILSSTTYGPLTPYTVPATSTYASTNTVTESTSVTISTLTSYVDGGIATADAGSTVTLDQRTSASACVSSQSPDPTVNKRASAPTCPSLRLQTAYLYVEMTHPIDFCKYYLSASRTRSPLAGVDAATLINTCTCVLKDAGKDLPPKKSDVSISPAGRYTCNKHHAAAIGAYFKQEDTFCTYWNAAKQRDLSAISGYSAKDLYSGCRCIK
ncbi:hypothetical protein K461DRAFT_306248 [Myriangium duriaei CBS 260.36]|uniref:Uncharacterized protein n=1 Tax=Myriangium duriaei CBS 260.36 TaxID=1168546 RepID=A0A9P4J2M5_9PEZI|nr:hypothetical protein K461DRAFT_306248 [Myriangium duriaei CBS 260.36]